MCFLIKRGNFICPKSHPDNMFCKIALCCNVNQSTFKKRHYLKFTTKCEQYACIFDVYLGHCYDTTNSKRVFFPVLFFFAFGILQRKNSAPQRIESNFQFISTVAVGKIDYFLALKLIHIRTTTTKEMTDALPLVLQRFPCQKGAEPI